MSVEELYSKCVNKLSDSIYETIVNFTKKMVEKYMHETRLLYNLDPTILYLVTQRSSLRFNKIQRIADHSAHTICYEFNKDVYVEAFYRCSQTTHIITPMISFSIENITQFYDAFAKFEELVYIRTVDRCNMLVIGMKQGDQIVQYLIL